MKSIPLAIASLALLASAAAAQTPAPQTATPPVDPDEARINDLVDASHILANEGVLDSYGHVTVRSAKNPSHFFMPRAMPPAQVTRADIVEVDMDCKAVTPNAPRMNGERYIHCETYKARPDVQSVIHSHDLAVIPLGITRTPLRPVVDQAGFLPPETPLFEVRDAYPKDAKERGIQITNPELGRALARMLGPNPAVLMARHGETVVGDSVEQATIRALYINIDARAETTALAIAHDVTPLDREELATYARENFDPHRIWMNYRQRMLDAPHETAPAAGK